jgi:hypothetical protein
MLVYFERYAKEEGGLIWVVAMFYPGYPNGSCFSNVTNNEEFVLLLCCAGILEQSMGARNL